MDDYAEYSLEEQLQVLKDNLPMLRDIHAAIEKFNEREEKLEIEHKVDVDLTDVKGSMTVENSLEVNDLPKLIDAVRDVVKTLDDKDYSPNIDVKASDVKLDMKNVEKLLNQLLKKDVTVNVAKDKIVFPQRAKDALPVKLVTADGKRFYDADKGGGGGGIGKLANIDIVESTDVPGVFGMVVLNPDGSSIGVSTPTPSNVYGSMVYGTGTYT